MKIQLERKLRSCPDRLRCVVCDRAFNSDRVRSLLCHDDGLIAGDVCPHCLKQGADRLRQELRDRAATAFSRISTQISTSPRSIDDATISLEREALELAEMAEQPLKLPPVYAWWWKKLEILAAETQALELARRGAANCHCRPRPKLTITFLNEEPY